MIERKKISLRIKNHLVISEPRFWFRAIPELNELANSDSDQLKKLIEYLQKPKRSGHECISIPYLIVKISLILEKFDHAPPWLEKASSIYDTFLYPLVRHIRIRRSGENMFTRGAGITLHYQPSIADESWMDACERPTTVRKPNLNPIRAADLAIRSLNTTLVHGIPWASGMSGCTNMSLFAWKHFNETTPIDPKAALLGIMMFLVYDGGHSLHEPLWAAHEVRHVAHFGFDVDSADNSEEFISDYQKFNAIFDGDMKTQISQAFDKSFDTVLEYFKKYSIFSPAKTGHASRFQPLEIQQYPSFDGQTSSY